MGHPSVRKYPISWTNKINSNQTAHMSKQNDPTLAKRKMDFSGVLIVDSNLKFCSDAKPFVSPHCL